jgi:phosphoglycerate dehydrogenase-like enzyme
VRIEVSPITNSSHVYDEPCAQQRPRYDTDRCAPVVAGPPAQRTAHDWNTGSLRADSYLLNGQTVLMLGYGAIAQRLAQLLAPFGVRIVAVRRQPRGDEEIEVISEDQLQRVLAEADHVVNILPANDSTHG